MGDVIEILTTATNTVEVEAQGPQGIPGVGVPTGGSALQVLRKKTGTDYDTEWAAAGSGSGSVTSVALASTDLTISGSPITESGTITANIAANAVTLEKLQTISSEHLLGRHGSGNGGVQQIGLGTGLAISGSNVRVATTGITAGTYTKLTIDETGRATIGATATPSDIGAAFVNEVRNQITLSSDITLESGRNVSQSIRSFQTSIIDVKLPDTNIQVGDTFKITAQAFSSGYIRITKNYSTGFLILATITAGPDNYTFQAMSSSADSWEIVLVDTHTHAASAIVSGAIAHERGGLEADVSAYNGLVKISGGSTSAVAVTSAGEALLDDADAAAQRTTLGLGTAAVEAASAFAQASHSHELTALAATGATNGHVLTANGFNGVTFAALPSSGVTGAAASASDVLGVSGSDITGVDANADRIVFWDDSASALKYLEVSTGLSLSGTTLTATGGGVTTGSVDNAILRADGTGGSTSQSSDIVIDDATTSTQANVALVNNHSETNSALVLTPKGTGAFIVGPKPDGTATGGNARGAGAIDIATGRTAATQVASGANAILIGGTSTASTADSIAIGRNVQSSSTFTTAVGFASSATNTRSTAYGNGAACTGSLAVALGPEISVSATEAIGIGWGATASATRAVCVASDNTANLRAGFFTWPFRAVYWGGQTTNDTPLILNLDATATSRFTIAASTALAVDILLVARRSNTQDKWLVARRFLGIRRDGSNNTSLIGSVQTLGTDQSDGSPSWTFALTADDTNEALQLEVTGAASETVQWRATAFYRVA